MDEFDTWLNTRDTNIIASYITRQFVNWELLLEDEVKFVKLMQRLQVNGAIDLFKSDDLRYPTKYFPYIHGTRIRAGLIFSSPIFWKRGFSKLHYPKVFTFSDILDSDLVSDEVKAKLCFYIDEFI